MPRKKKHVRKEDAPAYQRINERRQRANAPKKKLLTKQDIALRQWADGPTDVVELLKTGAKGAV